MAYPQLAQAIALEPVEHRSKPLVEGLGFVGDTHEDEPFPFRQRGSVERIVALIECLDLLHVRRADQTSVNRVGPRVVWTLDRLREASGPVTANPRTAMAADVEERAQLARAIAQNDQGLARHRAHHVVARNGK